MTLTFHYKEHVRRNGTKAVSPMIPITLYGPEESVEVSALLDSGADITVMDSEIAETLGLDLSGKKCFSFGVGGKVTTVETKVRVGVGKDRENYQFLLPVQVILDDCDFCVLLGRNVFFDKFKITFDQKNRKIMLKHQN